jgi:DNA-directed RNA polymerase subunit RPC12/RpoP
MPLHHSVQTFLCSCGCHAAAFVCPTCAEHLALEIPRDTPLPVRRTMACPDCGSHVTLSVIGEAPRSSDDLPALLSPDLRQQINSLNRSIQA